MMRVGASAMVKFGMARCVADLLSGCAKDDVYTQAEQVRSVRGTNLQHWAGRLAAKRAVRGLLTLPQAMHLNQIEILPAPSPLCGQDHQCLRGHPPAVSLRGAAATRAAELGIATVCISITHTATVAAAMAAQEGCR